MLLDVKTFRQRVDYDLDGLISDLQDETRRATPAEAQAWRNSLPAFAQVLKSEQLTSFHVQVGGANSLAVEYRLPASTCWADLVLLGRGESAPAVVIVELKDWNTAGDAPGPREGLVLHANREALHPSDQVRGYTEYCQRFHSTVQDEGAQVSGCVFFTFASTVDAYRSEPHVRLVENYPVFSRCQEDIDDRLPAYLASRLKEPDEPFAMRFARGRYEQDRSFVRQISGAIQRTEASPFVLLDEQRTGFEKCLKRVEQVLGPAKVSPKPHKGKKAVVIIEGPPGSGKSAIAAHLWAYLAQNDRIDGNVVLTTTSGSQKSNWKSLFEQVDGRRAASGVVLGANQYNPGLTPIYVKKQREQGREFSIESWRENLQTYTEQVGAIRCPDDSFAVSIVDEAHGLIDPTLPEKRGIPPSGWSMHAGPQAWHIIRSSRVSVFLMDGDQSYRDNETTTRSVIEAHAKEFGVDEVEVVSLEGSQFRCAGAAEYLDWLDATLGLKQDPTPPLTWRSTNGGPFEFELADSLPELEARLRERVADGGTARLLASYARPWKTQKVARPHGLPPVDQDFYIQSDVDDSPGPWSRIWNYAPEQDYTLFIQAPQGSYMAEDPLGEVGCPYVVRGFDFDYIGVLWLEDLVWRSGRWTVNLDHVHESAWKKTKSDAKKEKVRGPHTEELIRRLQRGYRILLSRAVKGAFVWCADEETRAHLEARLRSDRSRQGRRS